MPDLVNDHGRSNVSHGVAHDRREDDDDAPHGRNTRLVLVRGDVLADVVTEGTGLNETHPERREKKRQEKTHAAGLHQTQHELLTPTVPSLRPGRRRAPRDRPLSG